jgi:Cu+-exporting ATPase
MTFEAPRGASDQLTRTTLQIDAALAGPGIAQVIRALQRVPGVLLAEVNAATSRAIVAHDAAVPAASLLAAAAGAGVHARIVADTRTPATSVDPAGLQRARIRQLITFATTAFIALAVIDMLVPASLGKNWLLPVLVSVFWAVFFAEAIIRRRR